MNNKSLGNKFEQSLCEKLSEYGFWSHCMAMNKSGQPADIIAVKNQKAYLIDAKVCSNDTFPFSRIEENQDLAMELWKECGNGLGWFALLLGDEIYVMSHSAMKLLSRRIKALSADKIRHIGIPFEKWVTRCK